MSELRKEIAETIRMFPKYPDEEGYEEGIAIAILSLPEMVEMREKAEKWRESRKILGHKTFDDVQAMKADAAKWRKVEEIAQIEESGQKGAIHDCNDCPHDPICSTVYGSLCESADAIVDALAGEGEG